MQTLRDHTILYDEDCPMCKMYTGAFVATKMLDKNGRQAYQQMPENVRCKVDIARAVNENCAGEQQNRRGGIRCPKLISHPSKQLSHVKNLVQLEPVFLVCR